MKRKCGEMTMFENVGNQNLERLFGEDKLHLSNAFIPRDKSLRKHGNSFRFWEKLLVQIRKPRHIFTHPRNW